MFENIEFMQRISMFAVAFAVTMVFLFLWGQREERRTRAMEIVAILRKWGFDLLAKLFFAYGIGNYIGKDSVSRIIREIYSELTGSGLPTMLRKVGWKVVEGVFLKDEKDRARLTELLAKPVPKSEIPHSPAPDLPVIP